MITLGELIIIGILALSKDDKPSQASTVPEPKVPEPSTIPSYDWEVWALLISHVAVIVAGFWLCVMLVKYVIPYAIWRLGKRAEAKRKQK